MAAVPSKPAPCQITQASLTRAIYKRAKYHRTKYRRWVSRELAIAALREQRRTGFPALALAAVAEIESSYSRWARGPYHELGIYQLILKDPRGIGANYGPRKAAKAIPLDIRAMRKPWRRGKLWTPGELRNNVHIGAFVAVYEMHIHTKLCKRLDGSGVRFRLSHMRPLGKGWRRMPTVLGRIGHYNSGAKLPKWGYMRRLGRAYRGLRSVACQSSQQKSLALAR